MRSFIKILLAVVLICIVVVPSYAQRNVREAIVKIYTVYTKHDYDMPWQLLRQGRKYGSGCIISDKRILTNAHVVANQTFIQVKRAGQAKKYTAKVEIVDHNCDLAVLRVADDSFFSGAEPLRMGTLPKMGDRVAVYGFPMGGDELCITEGVVSRVEYNRYAHSGAHLLTCQIDAAINPGSSGGPVIKDGKIVGVAFQEYMFAQNIGYMVPVTVIDHFLEDIADGNYEGIPSLGINLQAMENPGLRSRYHMNDKQTGVLVKYIAPKSCAQGILKSADVILSIDGEPIANDGTIRFRDNERVYFEYMVHNKFIGDTVQCKILRDGKVLDVTIALKTVINSSRLVPYKQYDKAPTYYIVGGLVFQPLTRNYLDIWDELRDAPAHLVNYYLHGEPSEGRRQIIVLTKILGDEITVGYDDFRNHVISQVNGEKISSMEDFVKAIENNDGEYHIIVDEWGNQIVLERNKVDETNGKVLRKYKIDSDKSEDLK